MPVNGRVEFYEEVEYLCQSEEVSKSHTGDGSAVYSHGATGNVLYVADIVELLVGMEFEAFSTTASGGSWFVFYDGFGAPPGGITVSGAGYRTSVSVGVKLADLKIYGTGALFKVEASFDLYVNGAFDRNLGTLDALSDGLGPNYLPVIATPIELAWGATVAVTGYAGDPDDPYSFSATISSKCVGGRRFMYAGEASWEDLPVTLPTIPLDPDTDGCELGIGPGNAVTATRTWGDIGVASATESGSRAFVATVAFTTIVTGICEGEICYGPEEGPAECVTNGTADLWRTIHETDSIGGSVRLVGDLEKAFERIEANFREFWYRGGMPQTTARGLRNCIVDAVVTNHSLETEIHPAQSEIISHVQDAEHAIEDTLSYNSYAPMTDTHAATYTQDEYYLDTVETCVCPPSWVPPDACAGCDLIGWGCEMTLPPEEDHDYSETVSRVFPYHVDEDSDNPDLHPYQYHEEPLARYLAYWCNPHWSYFLWREDWEPFTWLEYWEPTGQQHLSNAALPPEEDTGQRTSIVSCCLAESAYTPFLDVFAAGMRWIGVNRPTIDGPSVPASLDYDDESEPLWTFEDCTAVFAAGGITITPDVGATTVVATLDLGSFLYRPFMYPHACDRVRPDWQLTNVEAVRAYLVGSADDDDLDRVLLEQTPGDGFTTRQVEYERPLAEDSGYAGSWAADNGAGVIADAGTDRRSPEGHSAEFMTDEERSLAYGLLAGRGAAKLRFEIDVTDDEADVELEYPRFLFADGAYKVTYESRQMANTVWPDGPGVRFGSWNFYEGGLTNPPLIAWLGYKASVIDWLCWRNLFLFGVAYDDNLTTELTQLFDTFEGQSAGQADHDSIAFPLPYSDGQLRAAIVNTHSEVPALCEYPHRKASDPLKLIADDDPAQVTYVLAKGRREYVANTNELHLRRKATDALITSAVAGMPSEWTKTAHDEAFTNSEGSNDFFAEWNGERFASLSNIVGHFAVLSPFGNGARCLSLDVHPDKRHAAAFVDDDDHVIVRIGDNVRPLGIDEIDTGIEAACAAVRWQIGSEEAKLVLVVADLSGDVLVYESTSEGKTWGVPTTIYSGGDAQSPAFFVAPTGERYIYWIVGSDPYDVKGRIYDCNMVAMSAEFTARSGVDAAGLAAAMSHAQGTLWRAELLTVEGGDLVHTFAEDGKAFS